jgi:hypothetical protein
VCYCSVQLREVTLHGVSGSGSLPIRFNGRPEWRPSTDANIPSFELKIIERACEVAWREIAAHDPSRDLAKDAERQEALRQRVFAIVCREYARSLT